MLGKRGMKWCSLKIDSFVKKKKMNEKKSGLKRGTNDIRKRKKVRPPAQNEYETCYEARRYRAGEHSTSTTRVCWLVLKIN